MTATKPARTMTVTCPLDLPYVTVTEGKRLDNYRVEAGFACVRWVHTGESGRGGNVRVNGAGKAIDCDCKAALYGRSVCRHRSGTEVLIARGHIEPGVVAETRDAVGDRPESWMHHTEVEG